MLGKLRILHIISDTNFGGAGRLLLNLSKCVNKERFEFIFAIPKSSKLFQQLKSEGRVYTFEGRGDRSFSISSIPSIVSIIKKTSPDIVHTHSSASGRIAAKICGKKIVFTKHCVFEVSPAYKVKLCRILYRLLDNIFADKIIAVADAAKKELIK